MSARPVAGFGAALRCELFKARRSRVPPIATAGFTLAPLMAGLFMIIMKDPEWAQRVGLLRTKADIFAGSADWPTFLGVIAQAVAVGGAMLFALLAAWTFGREFVDRTVKIVLAVPTPRWAIVLAKLVVAGGIAVLMTWWIFALGVVLGVLIGLPGGSVELVLISLLRTSITAALTILMITPVAFVACIGRGYMAPLGLAILTVFLAQVVAATGWGAWFPWSVPALFSGLAGPEEMALSAWSYVLVVMVSAAGLVATLVWWRVADQTT